MPRELSEQIVVRVTPELRAWLQADADAHGRTMAQSARWYLLAVLLDAETGGDK